MNLNISVSGYLRTALIIGALLILPTSAALAQVDFTSSIGQFIQQNPSVVEQNFESGKVVPTGLESCDSPVNQASNGDCFSPGDILPGIEFDSIPSGNVNLAGSFRGANLNPMNALNLDGPTQDMMITFPGNTVTAVGLNLGCLADGRGNCTGDLLNVDVFGANNVLLGSTQAFVTSQFTTFVGITSLQTIERVEFGDANPMVLSFSGVDTVLFGMQGRVSIPTLSQWGLTAAVLGFGITGFIAIRRRAAVKA